MKIYLVGGAIRDALLGLTVHEHDYVVVGSSPEEMLSNAFLPVGKDFPVFLHPDTREEYALARTEKKTGPGYHGFTFQADPSVSLNEDLKRRDLTINAIAQDDQGKLIDPYGGKRDIENKILRHVSEAFKEDPVRILRVARFSAKLPKFSICPETLELMKQMVNSGEVSALVKERVWQELIKTFNTSKPSRFFETLNACHAGKVIFPLLQLSEATLKNLDIAAGKPITAFSILLSDMNLHFIERFCSNLHVPNKFRESALLFKKLYSTAEQPPEKLLETLEKLDAFRRPGRLDQFIETAKLLSPDTDQVRFLPICLKVCQDESDVSSLIQDIEPKEIPRIIHEHRLTLIKNI